MMSVGSSSPRLGSISSLEKRDKTAGAPRAVGQRLRHGSRAEIVGDMAVKVLRLEPERAIGLGDGVLGVIAQNEEARAGVPLDDAVRLGAQVFL